jgi:CheY-like chemotaxis protein
MQSTPLILIAEDDEDTYELYSEFLASAGYSVIGASNGVEAVETAWSARPDLILMDVALPLRNGLDAARMLKSDARTRKTPILILSGFVQNCFGELTRQAGADTFLCKPCPLERLLAEIERLVAPRRESVLVIEDDAEIRELLAQILGEEGFAVSTAADGRQALDHLRTCARPPELIVLDLMMPTMDGWQFRSEQLADAKLRDIPVVVLTALSPAESTRRAIDAARILHKPIDLTELLDTVERVRTQDQSHAASA